MLYQSSDAYWYTRNDLAEMLNDDYQLLPNSDCVLHIAGDNTIGSVTKKLVEAYEAVNKAKDLPGLAQATTELADLHAELARGYSEFSALSTEMAGLSPSVAVGCIAQGDRPVLYFSEPDSIIS